jgi:hypothetical protein
MFRGVTWQGGSLNGEALRHADCLLVACPLFFVRLIN